MHTMQQKNVASGRKLQRVQGNSCFVPQHSSSSHTGNKDFWQRLHAFWKASVFTPPYLPAPLRQPLAGYILALLLPLLTVLGVFSLKDIIPALNFFSSPVVLAILIVSLGWGALPGLLATLWGAFLLGFVVLPPHLALTFEQIETFYSMFILVLVGLGITLLSTRVQHTHHQTIRARAEAEEARHKVESLLAELDNFISVVAHELRTPITAAKMCVQVSERKAQRILGSQSPSEANEKLLPLLQKNLQRIDHQLRLQNLLVDDLLDASRVRADRMELRPRMYNLAEGLQDCVEDQRTLHPERMIELNIPIGTELAVNTDPERVQQVINNYLTNALKYSDADKPVSITVSSNFSEITVSVQDKGPGLNEEQQKRIWERFYRAPGIHVRSGSGVSLGLGLFICSSIIERQGGRVGVTSAPGQGSTFWFTLPLI